MSKCTELFHQSLAILTVVMNELCLGISTGWIAPTIILLQKSTSPLPITLDQSSWIASLEHCAEIVGAVIPAFLLDITGRKPILAVCSLLFFLQWPFILFTNTVSAVYVARVAFGIGQGLNDGVSTVYLGENTTPKIRAIYGSFSVSVFYFMIMIELFIATYLPYDTTVIINAAVSFFAVLSIFIMKEPVQFLLMKGKIKQAEKNFMYLRGVTDMNEVRGEFENIQRNVYAEKSVKSSYKKILAKPANYKSLSIIIIIYILAASTGYYPIISYATTLFKGNATFDASELTVLLGVFQFLIVSVSSFIIDQFNRRTIVLSTFFILGLSHAATGLLYFINERITQVPYFSWLIFFTISVFISVHNFMAVVIYLIRSELFPLSIRAFGSCMAIVAYSLFNFLTTKFFIPISISYGVYYNFFTFSIVSFAQVVFVYFSLPETRNKTLIEIQEGLEKIN